MRHSADPELGGLVPARWFSLMPQRMSDFMMMSSFLVGERPSQNWIGATGIREQKARSRLKRPVAFSSSPVAARIFRGSKDEKNGSFHDAMQLAAAHVSRGLSLSASASHAALRSVVHPPRPERFERRR